MQAVAKRELAKTTSNWSFLIRLGRIKTRGDRNVQIPASSARSRIHVRRKFRPSHGSRTASAERSRHGFKKGQRRSQEKCDQVADQEGRITTSYYRGSSGE